MFSTTCTTLTPIIATAAIPWFRLTYKQFSNANIGRSRTIQREDRDIYIQRPLHSTKNNALATTTAHVTRTSGNPALFAKVPVASSGHTIPPCRSAAAGMSTCGIPYTHGTATLPCASAETFVHVRTSTSGSFGWKTASTCQMRPDGLSLPMFVKRASIGGLDTTMEWSSIERNFICTAIREEARMEQYRAYRCREETWRILNGLFPCSV